MCVCECASFSCVQSHRHSPPQAAVVAPISPRIILIMLMMSIWFTDVVEALDSRVKSSSCFLPNSRETFSFSDLVLQSNSDHNNMKGPLYLDIGDKNPVGVHHCMGEGDFWRLAWSLTWVVIRIMLFCFSLRWHRGTTVCRTRGCWRL